MKRFYLQIFLCFALLTNGYTQGCIPGTLTLNSQLEIDQFIINYPNCTNIEGTLIISVSDLTNLDGLTQIESIEGELIFTNNSFTDLSNLSFDALNIGSSQTVRFVDNPFLNNLTGIDYFLDGKFETVIIENNPELVDMSGFNSDGDLEDGLFFRIADNPQLTSLSGMENLLIVSGTIQIENNPSLVSLEGLDDVILFDRLELLNNPALNDLSALSQLTSFDKGLVIDNCDALVNLSGLDGLVTFGDGELSISNNNALTDLSGLQNLNNIAALYLTNNPNLTTLIHLNDLANVTENLEIINNPALQNLDGLEGITTLQENLRLEELPSITDLQGLKNLEFVGNNFIIEDIALGISDPSDLESLLFIDGNLEITNTGFVTLDGFDNLTSLGGRLYLQQNDVLESVTALSNITSIGNLLALRFNDILTSLDGLHNIDPNSMDSLNLFNNDLLEFCAQSNICSFLANGGGHEITGNAPQCNDIANLLFNCVIVDPIVTGKIYFDENNNCEDDNETPANDAILHFTDGGFEYYATSNETGIYELSIPDGTYDVSIINFNEDVWEVCNGIVSITVEDNQQLELNFGLQAEITCPLLNVDVSGGSLLPCEPTLFEVTYCNEGSAIATDIEVDIQLDEGFSFVGGSIIPSFNGTVYTFSIPEDLAINKCATFSFTAIFDPDCNTFVTAQTACVSAQIRPDDFCTPPSPLWDESSISIEGACDGDSIRFIITNTGTQPMADISKYIIIEDVIMIATGDVDDLPAGEFIELSLPADGSTIRLEVDQVEHHPGFSKPSFTVEGCDPDGDNVYSLGFYRQYPQNDIDPFVDIECMDVLESAYVNEHTADPLGTSEAHCLQNDIPIEYTLHFQNMTGNLINEVIILDTLSELLNISSIKAGSASHEYDFEVIDSGVAQFTFTNINLPDVSTDETGSRGFVSFKISQVAGNANGSIIENNQSILFDSIQVEMTDFVFHTVEHVYCIDTLLRNSASALYQTNMLQVSPNPFSAYTVFEWLDNNTFPNGIIKIYDVAGQEVMTIEVTGRQTILYKDKLEAGIYFYELSNETGDRKANGKLLIF